MSAWEFLECKLGNFRKPEWQHWYR